MLAGYYWETVGDVDAALKVTRRVLAVFTERDLPWLRSITHGRAAELCLHSERGAEARDHLVAALPVLQRLGARADAAGVRSWLVLANLQIGDTAEAERWLDGLANVVPDEEEAKSVGYDLGIRGEVRFARGEVDAGLRLWRRVVDRVRDVDALISTGVPLDLDPWVVEARSAAVVAHVRHDRLDLVADVADALREPLRRLLTTPLVNPPPYVVEQSLCGTLLLAVALADLARVRRTGDRGLARAAARSDAERADRAAYEEARSAYAPLDRTAIRAAALELLG